MFVEDKSEEAEEKASLWLQFKWKEESISRSSWSRKMRWWMVVGAIVGILYYRL